MRRIALAIIAALALVASGCFNSGSSTGSHATSSTPTVDWTVRYLIGSSVGRRGQLPDRCPAGARCAAVNLGTGHMNAWITQVTRTVSCPRGAALSPDCRAIALLRRVLAHRTHVCPCALKFGPPASATADVGGRRVTVPLDFCCAGKAAADAAVTLEPS